MNSIDSINIHFVLVGTTHSGNIGAAARAMKTMGYSSLRLVDPCKYLTNDAFSRASGAEGIIKNASKYDTLAEALADCTTVFGTSGRPRSLQWSTYDCRQTAEMIASHQCGRSVAVVFGRERTGLTNEELALCTHQLQIPSEFSFSSLNLGSAVQVLAYELRVAKLARAPDCAHKPVLETEADDKIQMADVASMEHFYAHLERALIQIKFLDPDNPRLLMRRLRRYFNRNKPDAKELNILRGVLTATEKSAQKKS